MFRVNHGTIGRIVRRENWTHIPEIPGERIDTSARGSKESREKRDRLVLEMYAQGQMSRRQLAAHFNVGSSTIDAILTRMGWNEIKATRQKEKQ